MAPDVAVSSCPTCGVPVIAGAVTVGGAIVKFSVQPPLIEPASRWYWSTTSKRQTPLGLAPLNVERLLPQPDNGFVTPVKTSAREPGVPEGLWSGSFGGSH